MMIINSISLSLSWHFKGVRETRKVAQKIQKRIQNKDKNHKKKSTKNWENTLIEVEQMISTTSMWKLVVIKLWQIKEPRSKREEKGQEWINSQVGRWEVSLLGQKMSWWIPLKKKKMLNLKRYWEIIIMREKRKSKNFCTKNRN